MTVLETRAIKTFSGGGGGTYLVVITRSSVGSTAGNISSLTTPHTVTSMRVAFQVRVYANGTYDATGCEPSTDGPSGPPFAPVCTLGFVLHLSGSTTSTSTSSTFSFTGSTVGGVAAFPNCPAGPAHMIGTTGVVSTAITGHLTT